MQAVLRNRVKLAALPGFLFFVIRQADEVMKLGHHVLFPILAPKATLREHPSYTRSDAAQA
ncbi:hypothetical protein BJD99_19100 [Rhodococcus sp. 1163]|uniref:hypothetical protein n=1 Tax=Rhodococcus sp. 1163 TaxID=1905289 RepID=UPI000A0CA64E|nr:hypothetical protein [Rhodococcus sp. 1163]ORI18851.1 hypothetical protein BJD99_19100 [Rhodococcus sp. 1163]